MKKLDNSRPQLFERIFTNKFGENIHMGFRLYYPDGRCFWMYEFDVRWAVSCFAHNRQETKLIFDTILRASPSEDNTIEIAWLYPNIIECKKAAEKWEKDSGVKTEFVCYW